MLAGDIRARDRAAFVHMFTVNYSALRDYGVGIVGSVEVAEEIVQDVFVRLWEIRGTWDVQGNGSRLSVRCRAEPCAERQAKYSCRDRAH